MSRSKVLAITGAAMLISTAAAAWDYPTPDGAAKGKVAIIELWGNSFRVGLVGNPALCNNGATSAWVTAGQQGMDADAVRAQLSLFTAAKLSSASISIHANVVSGVCRIGAASIE
ncbi:hypothetical protein [Pyxidicoccus caerfyrddinensis]|uniref:hypothetical protein n=1 Tax=Pyxidicoccus caerfyrddinensis TaxID=2709663 RepID=UPI0013DABBCD|nr:hypothetical protein [Pyxidicoccus caerfyrddinensis]